MQDVYKRVVAEILSHATIIQATVPNTVRISEHFLTPIPTAGNHLNVLDVYVSFGLFVLLQSTYLFLLINIFRLCKWYYVAYLLLYFYFSSQHYVSKFHACNGGYI